MWYETDKSELVLAQLLCLQASKPSPYLYKCHESGGDQEWKHKGTVSKKIFCVQTEFLINFCTGVQYALYCCVEIEIQIEIFL